MLPSRPPATLPRTGELTPDNVAVALGEPAGAVHAPAHNLAPRPPQLCQGCGHRDVYTALNKVLADYPTARVFGDIGCYTLGALPPFRAIDSCVDMGASITMAKGAADAGVHPAIAVIGDSTFTHSGMTSLGWVRGEVNRLGLGLWDRCGLGLDQVLHFVIDQAAQADDLFEGTVVAAAQGPGEPEPLGRIEPFDTFGTEQLEADLVLVLAHLLHGD